MNKPIESVALSAARTEFPALERWIEANGYRTGGAPWESYITDPADLPDPADWRTEVYWPLEQ